MKNNTLFFIKVLLVVTEQRFQFQESSVIKYLIFKKIALKAKLGLHSIMNVTTTSGYSNYDKKMLKKTYIISEIEKVELKYKAVNRIFKLCDEIIQRADFKYRLHLINIYLLPDWTITKEANKYGLERHKFAKEIHNEMDRIVTSKDIQKLIELIKETKEPVFTKLLKREKSK